MLDTLAPVASGLHDAIPFIAIGLVGLIAGFLFGRLFERDRCNEAILEVRLERQADLIETRYELQSAKRTLRYLKQILEDITDE